MFEHAGLEPFNDWPGGLGSGWRLVADRAGLPRCTTAGHRQSMGRERRRIDGIHCGGGWSSRTPGRSSDLHSIVLAMHPPILREPFESAIGAELHAPARRLRQTTRRRNQHSTTSHRWLNWIEAGLHRSARRLSAAGESDISAGSRARRPRARGSRDVMAHISECSYTLRTC